MKKHVISLLSGIGLSLACAAQAGPAITRINAASINGTEQVLEVTFDGPVPTPASFSLSNPPRIAFDFVGVHVKLPSAVRQLGNPLIKSATAVEAGGRTRLVLNLSRNAAYTTQIHGNKFNVHLSSDLGAARPRTTPTPAPRAPTAPPSSATIPSTTVPSVSSDSSGATAIDFRRGANNEGRVEIMLPSASTAADVRRERGNIVVLLPGQPLPPNQVRKLDVTDFGTAVKKIDASNQGRTGRIVIEPRGSWDYSSYQTDRKLVVEVRKLEAEKSAKAGPPVYKGEKLSLDFQNIDVRTVLQVIADFTGLNIVASDTVTGSITLRLKDVPWDQALDLILQAKGLDQRRIGNVVQIAPREELLDRDKKTLEAQKQIETLEPTRSETFVLKYRSTDDFKVILDTDSGSGTTAHRQTVLSERGSVLFDPKSNTIIINDTPTVIEKVRALVDQLDKAQRQVLIEARIVEANDNFSRDLGVKLGFTRLTRNTSIANDFNTAIDNTNPAINPIPVLGPSVDLPATLGTPASIAIISRAAGRAVGLELSAMQAESKGKIISSPRVLTADGTEANIQQGTQIPYQSATSSGATAISFVNAVLSLKVKPQVTPDGNIILTVAVNKDSPSATLTVNGTPAINTTTVQTQTMVENGGTVVIGGIYLQDEGETVNKVPLLGDIPILGNLFKQRGTHNDRRELIVFLTPRLVDDLSSFSTH
jgi:type IV pilus assembly protein PilQ